MQVIVFEDSLVDRLSPIVHARAAHAISCAGHRLIDWLNHSFGPNTPHALYAVVRDYLQGLQSLDHGLSPPVRMDDPEDVLLVNARLIPSVDLAEAFRVASPSSDSWTIHDDTDDAILLSRISAKELIDLEARDPIIPILGALERIARSLPRPDDLSHFRGVQAFRFPHDVVAAHMRLMPSAMAWRIEHGDYRQLQDGVFVGEGVQVGEYASIHTSDGPIILEDHVKIGPFCFLEGPLYAGRGTRVLEHAAIKDGVSLGHTVKIGGEVEASVIEPFTNKQHHGFLGHSYLGSWINLGAGTCNSDLKNTYGKINIEYGDNKVATDMQFLGCIMGDYSKSAINTGIFTGKVIGVCSMLYGFVTSNVPSYVNYARLFGQTSVLPADVMVNTQQRMFARRKVEQRDCDMQLIHDMYRRTDAEREAEHLGL